MKEEPKPKTAPRFGVALGGGGSRALAHLGVLTTLQEAGIHMDVVAGSSMGGLLGAMYAASGDAVAVRDRAVEFFRRDRGFGSARRPVRSDRLHGHAGVFAWLRKFLRSATLAVPLLVRRGVLWGNPCRKAVNALLPDTRIETLPLPFGCVALNLTEGRVETFTQGSLREPVLCGTTVGVVFPPRRMGGAEYIDAAPLCAVPVRLCRALGADVVLAVDLRSPVPTGFRVQNGFDVIQRIEQVASRTVNDTEAAEAAWWIRPETGPVFWGDFTNLDPILNAGAEAVRAVLPAIRARLELPEEPGIRGAPDASDAPGAPDASDAPEAAGTEDRIRADS